MKKKMLPALFMLLFASQLLAQGRFQAGGSFTVVSPRGAFRENVDNLGYGLTGFFAWRIPESPVLLGASFGFNVYGTETWEEPLVGPVFVDVTTTNALMNGLFFIRLQPANGAIRPYLDGLAGFNYLTTDSQIDDVDDYEEIASSKNYDDWTSAHGLGGGLHIQVWEAKDYLNGPSRVFVDLGVRYLKGGEARYLKKDGIEEVDGDFIYHVNRSTTHVTTFHVGVSVDF